MQHPESSRLLTLDAMRGLAAVAVILWHLNFVGPLAQSGYLAVDFFFLMSGVVIAKAYQDRLDRGLTLLDFLMERLIRLYPLYFLGFLIGLVRLVGQIAANHPGRMTWPDLGISAVFNLLMLPSPVTALLAPINIPSWSLFFELLVNMVWAGALIKASTGTLAAYVAFLGVALCAAVMAAGSAQGGWIWAEIHLGVIRSFFGFGLGVLLTRSIGRKRARDSVLSVMAAISLCAIFVVGIPPQYRAVYDLVAILLFFPAIVCMGATFNPPAGLKRVAHALGDISYPVYMLHFGPTFTLSYIARKFGLSAGIWIPLFIMGICSISLYLARTYDPAARRYLKNVLARRRTKMTSVA
jgi:peptidoglycan/LPS O-acetylase OafA/YrhL